MKKKESKKQVKKKRGGKKKEIDNFQRLSLFLLNLQNSNLYFPIYLQGHEMASLLCLQTIAMGKLWSDVSADVYFGLMILRKVPIHNLAFCSNVRHLNQIYLSLGYNNG